MDGMPILKRPKPTDSEEELFHMQEEFLKNKQEPSAKVINLRGSTTFNTNAASNTQNQISSSKIRSKFSQSKKLKTQSKICTSQYSGNLVNPAIKEESEEHLETGLQDSIQNLPITPSRIILGNIIEKKYNESDYKQNERQTSHFHAGFPEVFEFTHTKNEKKQSLFWQQLSNKGHVPLNTEESADYVSLSTNDTSFIVEGSWADDIHKENVEKLCQMSKEDILKEKIKLEALLKPELIQFLKDRRTKKQKIIQNEEQKRSSNVIPDPCMESSVKYNLVMEKMSEKSQEDSKMKDDVTIMQVDAHEQNMPKPPVELMLQAKEKGWVHMASLEPEKLKWMEDIPTEKESVPAPDEPYNARFDFNGVLLAYKDESVPIEKGLHHHGEEPERPGYTLQELLQLSRSSTQQQRCTALTTLANIMEKSRKGWYDKVLQPAPLIALNQRNILLLLRFSLDDTSLAVVTSTLQALRAFLYSEADEVCLDRLYGFQNYEEPILATPKTDIADTSNLKDHELAQLDSIASLLRTDILVRIRYILREMRPPPIGVTCALEILIRLVRHSPITALEIANTPYLLETIIEHFMPLSTDSLARVDTINNVYGIPVITAVRFCRILLCYEGKSVTQKLCSFKIVQRILSYVTCDAGEASFNLSIESLRLWRTLILHGAQMDSLYGAQLILVSQLQLLLSNHDIQTASELSCEYAAALIAVASCLAPLKANISVLLTKWCTQLLSLNNFTWGKMKLIAETLLAVSDTDAVKTLIISRSLLFSKLGSTSNLLSECLLATEREPSSLPHLGVLTQDGQIQPIVSHESCIPFLTIALNILSNHCILDEIQAVLNHPQLYKYLKQVQIADWHLEKSWYTRLELLCLVAMVNAVSLVKDRLHNTVKRTIWAIAVKLVSSLPADCPSAVKNMLRVSLAKEKLSLEIMAHEFENLSLKTNLESIKLNLNRDVHCLYEKYVALNGTWEQAAMPKDWIYLPLIHIYTKCRNNIGCNDDDKIAILTVLTLELILPDLVKNLSHSLRFSRLILVYLCDTLYLNNDVSALLTTSTSSLRNNYKKLNFTADLPGLNSFTDLFTVMCEHFCSTSYGDHGFSMVLLVPIAQRHDVHYRKLLWSEHAGSLRYIRLPLEKLVIPLKEYLYPLEEDTSLIESYITALVRGTVRENWCPIPYTIAVHHAAMYLKQSNTLAARMKKQLEKIPNKALACLLLNYQPPTL